MHIFRLLNSRSFLSFLLVISTESCKTNHENDWGAEKVSKESEDSIVLQGNSGHEPATALLYGRRKSGCTANESFVSENDRFSVGDFGEPRGCNADLAVFALDSEFFFEQGVKWTDSSDKESVSLAPRIELPIKVWILDGDPATRAKIASADLNRANQLFNESRCGFRLAEIGDPVDLTTAGGVDDLKDIACVDIQKLESRWHKDHALNAYYIGTGTARGEACDKGDVETGSVLISRDSDGETLAHEVGHEMSLADADGILPQSSANIMLSGVGRSAATKGQCFRINLSPNSWLVANQRPSPSRSCPKTNQSPQCPGLGFNG
jgi:hypothetical protein